MTWGQCLDGQFSGVFSDWLDVCRFSHILAPYSCNGASYHGRGCVSCSQSCLQMLSHRIQPYNEMAVHLEMQRKELMFRVYSSNGYMYILKGYR